MPPLTLSQLIAAIGIKMSTRSRLHLAIGHLLLLRPDLPSRLANAAALVGTFANAFERGEAQLYYDHFGACFAYLQRSEISGADTALAECSRIDGFIVPGQAAALYRALSAQITPDVACSTLRRRQTKSKLVPIRMCATHPANKDIVPALHPDFVESCKRNVAYVELLGNAAYLAVRSGSFDHVTVEQILQFLQTPLLLRQYVLETDATTARESMTLWADVTTPTLQRLRAHPRATLHPSEWSAGTTRIAIAQF